MNTKKKYLNQYSELRNLIFVKIKELKVLEEDLLSLAGVSYSDIKVQNSKNYKDAFYVGIILNIDKLREELYESGIKLKFLYEEISNAIDKVSVPRYINVLILKHLACLTFQEIAVEMYCSDRQVFRIYKNALRVFELPKS